VISAHSIAVSGNQTVILLPSSTSITLYQLIIGILIFILEHTWMNKQTCLAIINAEILKQRISDLLLKFWPKGYIVVVGSLKFLPSDATQQSPHNTTPLTNVWKTFWNSNENQKICVPSIFSHLSWLLFNKPKYKCFCVGFVLYSITHCTWIWLSYKALHCLENL
jgi:hypothetical protein